MPADVSQLLALAADYDAAGPKIASSTVAAVSESADIGVDTAKAWAPRRTGTLADEIDKVVDGGGGAGGARARVRSTAPYAWFVYAGTARQAPQPAYLDNGRDAAERDLETRLPAKIEEAMP